MRLSDIGYDPEADLDDDEAQQVPSATALPVTATYY